MANTVLGDVALQLGGESFTLRLDMNAWCELEAETGQLGHDVLATVADPARRSMRLQRALAWAALQRHHPGTTLREAGDIVDRDPKAFWDAMGRALGASIPAGETTGKDAAGNAPPGGANAAAT